MRASMTSDRVPARAITFGKYRAIAELGVGGMAEVYLAVAHGVAGFSKLHVIKRLRTELAEEQQFLGMFMDEARLAARLNHPNIVQTYEVAVENGEHFLVLEYVDGEPLTSIVRQAREVGEAIPLDLHLKIIHDMLGGLHYAHEAKDFDGTPLELVHRDISPHNVMVSVEGNVKLVDFGVAKAVTSTVHTLSGTIKGKVRYLSPEQVAGERVDRRSDIFAVGVMLWEALAGEKLWGNESQVRIIARLVAGDIPRLPAAQQETGDKDLLRIVEKALAVEPENRYATAADLRSDLADYLHARGKRTSEQAIGALVQKLFASRRSMIRSAIERRQADFQAEDFSGPLLDLQSSETDSSPRRIDSDPTRLDSPGSKSSVRGTALATANDIEQPIAAPSRSGTSLGIIAIAVVLAIGVVVLGVQRWSSPTSSPAPPADSALPPQAETISVNVQAMPTSAVLLLDDEKLPANPFIGTYDKDDKDHVIRVQANGFDAQRMTVKFTNDVTVRVTLVATAVSAIAQSASSQPAPTATSTAPRIAAPPSTKHKPVNQFDPGDPWK